MFVVDCFSLRKCFKLCFLITIFLLIFILFPYYSNRICKLNKKRVPCRASILYITTHTNTRTQTNANTQAPLSPSSMHTFEAGNKTHKNTDRRYAASQPDISAGPKRRRWRGEPGLAAAPTTPHLTNGIGDNYIADKVTRAPVLFLSSRLAYCIASSSPPWRPLNDGLRGRAIGRETPWGDGA